MINKPQIVISDPALPVVWRLDSWERLQVTENHQTYSAKCSSETFKANGDGSVVFQYGFKGHIFTSIEGKTIEIPEKTAYLFPTGQEPRWKEKGDGIYHCAWVRLQGAGLLEHWRWIRSQKGLFLELEEDSIVMTLFMELTKIHERQAHWIEESKAIHRFVMALIEHITVMTSKKQEPVHQAIECLQQHPLHEWSLKAIANKFGVSREHFTRVFTQVVGLAPAQWLRNQRLQHAKKLLRETHMSIKAVSVQSGLSSTDTLARWLQEDQQCSPLQYRIKHHS